MAEGAAAQIESPDPFAKKAAAAMLIAGSLMPALGWLIRPAAIEKHIEIQHVVTVAASPDAWVWSYRFLVFGLFIRLGGLVSLATLFRAPATRALMLPGIVISSAGLAIDALQEGYYMDEVIHCAWRFGNDATSDAARASLLSSIMPMTEWASCLARMSNMFVALGAAIMSFALFRSADLGRAIAYLGGLIAFGLMGLIMIKPDGPSGMIAFIALSAWHLLVGAMTMRWSPPQSSPPRP
jgi:hypothetical protein